MQHPTATSGGYNGGYSDSALVAAMAGVCTYESVPLYGDSL